MKILKKYGNKLNFIANRISAKDMGNYLGISPSSVYRYRNHLRAVPENLQIKIDGLKNSLPKQATVKINLKKQRFKKINKKESLFLQTIDSEKYKSKQWIYLYTGNLKNIEDEIKRLYKMHIAYGQIGVARIVKKIKLTDKNLFDSTFNYNIDLKKGQEGLMNSFAKIMNKYQDIINNENDVQFEFTILITLFL